MKKKVFSFLALFFLINTQVTFAQSGGLTSCDEKTYCEGGRWIKKSGCKLTSSVQSDVNACKGDDACISKATSDTDICTCDFQVLSGTCDTPGGIREAQDAVKDVFGRVDPPAEISRLGFGEQGVSNVLQVIIRLIYIVGAIAFVLLFLYSAVQFILSGGDKEAVAKARGRITWAIIGLALLGFAFVIFRVLETVLGFKLIT